MALAHVNATHYSTYSNPVRAWTHEILEEFTKNGQLSEKYSRVLDLGCGTGENTQFLADQVNADFVTAVDEHAGFLSHAQKNCKDERIEFKKSNLNKESWTAVCDDKKYDLVCSFFFLHWNANNETLLRQISDMMEENGESFHVFGIMPDERFLHTMKQMLYHETWSPYFDDFKSAPEWMARVKQTNTWGASSDPAAAMKTLLKNSGHDVLTCKTKKVSYRAESEAECRGMLQWLLPITRFIPQTKLEAFMDDAMLLFEKNTLNMENFNEWATTIMIVHTKHCSPESSSSGYESSCSSS